MRDRRQELIDEYDAQEAKTKARHKEYNELNFVKRRIYQIWYRAQAETKKHRAENRDKEYENYMARKRYEKNKVKIRARRAAKLKEEEATTAYKLYQEKYRDRKRTEKLAAKG